MRTFLRRFQAFFVFFAIGALFVTLFENCGVERPSVTNREYASVTFMHTGQETSCSGCHELSRPTNTVGFIALNPNTPFDYFSHGSGNDCISCHKPTSRSRTREDWAGGYYVHSPLLTTCVTCHSSQRPTAIINGFNHATSGTGECFSCHQGALKSSFSNMSDWSGGTTIPSTLVWDPSQDINIVAQIPTYMGASIQSLTPQNQSLHMAMNHQTTQLMPTDLKNCALCHAGADTGNYLPGEFHTALSATNRPQPTSCTDCHNSSVRPKGFVGHNDAGRVPPSQVMKHDAVAWVKNAAGNYEPGTAPIITTDCATCHKQPGTAWKNTVYHQSLTAAGLTQPSSCLDCHANSRPLGPVPAVIAVGGTRYDHANLGGQGDCITCHTSKTSWSGGSFHTTQGKPASCLACHESARPTSTAGFVGLNPNTPFDYNTHGSPLDCVTCHAATNKFTAKTDWSGGYFTHSANLTSCASCHSSQRPTAIVNGFDHSKNGTGDCIGCHRATLTRNQFASLANWAGGESVPTGLVGAKTVTVASIKLNYSGTRVVSTSAQSQVLPYQMLHSSTQVPAGIANNCAACHSQAANGIYAGGRFHASLTANSLPQPTSCRDCHNGTLPVDIVGPTLKPMDHAAALSGGGTAVSNFDCATCHTQPGVSFSDGRFHFRIGNRTPTNCTTCHYPVMPKALINKMAHTSNYAVQDCLSCHALPNATQANNPAATNWAGGLYHGRIAVAPTSCVDCHQGQKPSSVTVSTLNSQHMSHVSANVSSECATCHLADQNTSPRAWQRNTRFHAIITNPATCQDCHGLTNGGGNTAGTNNDLPAGLTASDTRTTSSVAAANTFDQITHRDINVAGKDCKVCHTQVGPGGSNWKSGQFHTKVTQLTINGTTGRCDNCHMNIKPAVLTNGFNHGTIGTQDCSACHTYPGTGTQAAGNWRGAKAGGPHTAAFITSTANTCVSCHTTGGSTVPPVGMPTNIRNTNQTGSDGKRITFAHTFTSKTAGSAGTSTVTYSMSVCLGCHNAAATKAMANNGAGYLDPNGWVGTGTFNHRLPNTVTFNGTATTVTSASAIQSCLPCHINEALSGTKHNLNCVSPQLPSDCVQCHTTGGSWRTSKGGRPVCK